MISALFNEIDWRVKAATPKKLLYYLVAVISVTAIIGLAIFSISFLYTLFESRVINSSICISSRCVQRFYEYFSGSFLILQNVGGALTTMATIGGIFVALLNYLQNVESSTQSNSIAHMNLFLAQTKQEITARSRLSLETFDLLAWYNTAFIDANNGRKLVAEQYVGLIVDINREIKKTNDSRMRGGQSIDFMDHQARLRRSFKPLGISISAYPRSDFIVIEDQILDLLTSIHQSFCRARAQELRFFARDYR